MQQGLGLLLDAVCSLCLPQLSRLMVCLPLMSMLAGSACEDRKARPPTGSRARARGAQQTETVQPGVPCSLRAKANAFSAGISRIFLTGLPRRPKNSTSQGVVPSFWTPG